MTERLITITASLALALLACSDDAGTDAVDAQPATDAPAATSPVTGTIVDRHITSSGEEQVPVDLAASFDLELMTVDADGVFTTHPGTGTADGTFEFADVPAGMTYLRRGIRYFATDQREFDLSLALAQRANAQPTAPATVLDLQFDGLAPWAQDHELQLSASGADVWMPLPPDNVPATDGATTLATSVDYHAAGPHLLIDTAEGDEAWFTQLVPQAVAGSTTYSSIVKALNVPTLQLQDGQATNITGTFQDIPQDLTIDLDWRGTEFASLTPQMLPAAATPNPEQLLLVSSASFNPLALGAQSSSADMFHANISPLDQDIAFTATVGNPFPERWEHVALVVWITSSTVPDGAGGTVELTTRYVEQKPMDELFGRPVQPQISPVQDLRIDGLDADVMQTGLPESPELTWSPPAQGAPAFYEIRASLLQPTGNTLLARIRTADTALRIPPGLMEAGSLYAFEVVAWSGDNLVIAGPFGIDLASTAGRTTHIMTR